MDTVRFEFEWERSEGIRGAELRATWASLRIGAEDMLATDIPFILEAQLTTIDVPNLHWISERA